MVVPLRDDNPTARPAVVTMVLIALNVVVFAFLQPHTSPEDQRFAYEHAAIPCELTQGSPLTAAELATGRCGSGPVRTSLGVAPSSGLFAGKSVYLAAFASMFLHGSWLHLLGNMLFLWVFGNNVEDRFGHVAYALFYVLAGFVALGTDVLVHPHSTVPIIGASGAIAGVMGAYLALWPRARVLTWIPLLIFIVVPLPAAAVLGVWFVLQFVTQGDSGVAWVAHVGGFAAGVVVGLVVARLPRRDSGTRDSVA